MMRFLSFFLICTLCLGFVSCGGDDDPEPEPTPDPDEFVWNGDWNDPDDKNYKPEGYNPIVGDWVSEKNPNVRLIFTEDFVFDAASFDGFRWETKTWSENYVINNNGIKYKRLDVLYIEEYKLVKESGIDYLILRYHLSPDEWRRYRRYLQK
ncbi:MAG: hypothetical protein E6767_02270 [Dysgonomonas sp.]|nr:hypothetical protein [Dysgonomonas sp.]